MSEKLTKAQRQRKDAHRSRKQKGREAHAATFDAWKRRAKWTTGAPRPAMSMFLAEPQLSIATLERLLGVAPRRALLQPKAQP